MITIWGGYVAAFQCSSASRKFLNFIRGVVTAEGAGFQCSSASRKFLNLAIELDNTRYELVSVLFSEPKIPQYLRDSSVNLLSIGFSALQRAENSSMQPPNAPEINKSVFQCSSASRKFLNLFTAFSTCCLVAVSVLFSEPKIPQSCARLVAAV